VRAVDESVNAATPSTSAHASSPAPSSSRSSRSCSIVLIVEGRTTFRFERL